MTITDKSITAFEFKKPKPIFVVIKGFISLALILWLVRASKIAWTDMTGANLGHLFLASLFLLLQPILLALRWRQIVRRLQSKLAPLRALAITFISVFFNQVLPASVGGDVIRVWYVTRDGMKLQAAIASVILDRVIALLALLLLIGLCLPWSTNLIGDNGVRLTLAALAAAGFLGIVVLFTLEPLLQRWKDTRLVRILIVPSQIARQVLLSARTGVFCFSYSFLIHALSCAATWQIARAYGVDLSFMQALILVPPVILALTLPVSLGGWGVREAAMVAALGIIGVPAHMALVISLMLGVLIIVANLPGLPCWIIYRPKNLF